MKKGAFFKILRVFAVFLVAIVIAKVLVALRPEAERRTVEETGRLVEVFAAKAEKVQMYIDAYGTVEPREAPYISKGIFRPHRMMGTAPGFVPETLDRAIIDEIYLVTEPEAFDTCRRLARTEGILVGISSGAAAYAALRVARRSESQGKVIVCMFADTGERYLSVKGLFSEAASQE